MKRIKAVHSDDLLADGVSIIQRLQNSLLECLQSYAMTESAQAGVMVLLKDATLFRRKANARIDRQEGLSVEVQPHRQPGGRREVEAERPG